jgi:hypothetical protein
MPIARRSLKGPPAAQHRVLMRLVPRLASSCSPAFYAYMQSGLNGVWTAQAETTPATA